MRIILFVIIFSFVGCMEELEQAQQEMQANVPQIGKITDEIKTLSSEEFRLAKDFCQALSEKESTFPRDYTGATISFKVKRRECAKVKKQETREAVIQARLGSDTRSGNLRYFPMDYYLPLMTNIETANQGLFSEFCPEMLLDVQRTNSRTLENGTVQIFRFVENSRNEVMVQVLSSELVESEVVSIDEVVVETLGSTNRPRGLVTRKIRLEKCGDLDGNQTAFLWSQEL